MLSFSQRSLLSLFFKKYWLCAWHHTPLLSRNKHTTSRENKDWLSVKRLQREAELVSWVFFKLNMLWALTLQVNVMWWWYPGVKRQLDPWRADRTVCIWEFKVSTWLWKQYFWTTLTEKYFTGVFSLFLKPLRLGFFSFLGGCWEIFP